MSDFFLTTFHNRNRAFCCVKCLFTWQSPQKSHMNIWASPFRSSSWSRWTSPTMVFFSSFRSRRLASRWLVVGDLAATGCAIFHLDRLFFSASPEVALGNALQCQPLLQGFFRFAGHTRSFPQVKHPNLVTSEAFDLLTLCCQFLIKYRHLHEEKLQNGCHQSNLCNMQLSPHSAWRWNPPEMPACPSTWRDQLLKPRCV